MFHSGGFGQHAGDLCLACSESRSERGLLDGIAFHLVQQDLVRLVEHELHPRLAPHQEAASASGMVPFFSSSSARTKASSMAIPAGQPRFQTILENLETASSLVHAKLPLHRRRGQAPRRA